MHIIELLCVDPRLIVASWLLHTIVVLAASLSYHIVYGLFMLQIIVFVFELSKHNEL